METEFGLLLAQARRQEAPGHEEEGGHFCDRGLYASDCFCPLLLFPAVVAHLRGYRHKSCGKNILCMPDYLLASVSAGRCV